jgi:hypothetical protein
MDSVTPGHGRSVIEGLEAALLKAPGFRNESNGRPLVYGYVRSRRERPNYLTVCRSALERYCQHERLRLCTVFTDLGVSDEAMTRPGLTGLCDVLRLPDSFAAVLVSVKHLSPVDRIAEHLAQQLRDTGARLLFVRPEVSKATAGAVNGPCKRLPEWWQ